jgi:signal transduction histidine kinase
MVRHGIARLLMTSSGHDTRLVRVLMLVVALIVSVTIFSVDTFTSSDGAIAVLYSLVILLVAEPLTANGILMAAGLFTAMSAISFWASFSAAGATAGVVHLSISAATISLMSAILYRHKISRAALLATNSALVNSEARFRAIFEQSRVALWEQDFTKLRKMLSDLKARGVTDLRDYAVSKPTFLQTCADLIESVSINDATVEMLGRRSKNEVVGSVRQFIPTEADCLFELIECIFLNRGHFEGKGKVIRQDGSFVPVLLNMNFPDDEAGFDRVVVAMFDITQREIAQHALLSARAEMAKVAHTSTVGALSASLIHELNQPIGAVVLNAQSCLRWLRRDTPDIASASEAAERIVRDARRMAEVLTTTRHLFMHTPAQPEPSDLRQLIGETCSLLDHELTSGSIVLQTRLPLRLPRVSIARAELQQVLVNLLSNGIQAINTGGGMERRLALECVLDGNADVSIIIRDHGPGIKPENLTKVFEPFFTTKATGMGIGLSICRSMVEARGGKLTAANHEGGGAIFQLRLPVEAPLKRGGMAGAI